MPRARSTLDSATLDQTLSYEAFRTGLSFRDVYHLIYERRWKRRRGVLGAWREIKLSMWAHYLDLCDEARERRRVA